MSLGQNTLAEYPGNLEFRSLGDTCHQYILLLNPTLCYPLSSLMNISSIKHLCFVVRAEAHDEGVP